MTRARHLAVTLLLLSLAGSAYASWYDDYDDGLAAANAGNWALVVQKMSAAIAGNPKENNKARTYGAIFINYHPYYYRGIGYLNTGKYQQAIEDLERTSGPGPVDLGSLGDLLRSAKAKLQAASAPAPAETKPEPAAPPPVIQQPQAAPASPAMDAGLRQRAVAALNAAKQRLLAAQQRKATASPQYQQAMSSFTNATTRNASSKTNDDLNDVINLAESAATFADLAAAPGAVAAAPSTTVPTPKSVTASDTALADEKARLRRALEQYFAGEFDVAARELEDLSRRLPNNPWVFAFLGAAQYSRYAFEADESYRRAAEASFRRAKSLRTWKDGLPQKYFSKRIRKAFTDTAG